MSSGARLAGNSQTQQLKSVNFAFFRSYQKFAACRN
jgi:hypothetical protein